MVNGAGGTGTKYMDINVPVAQKKREHKKCENR
jgi:hypothetical protein